MDMSAGQRRRDFGVWMRTGRWPSPDSCGEREVKFNPWHDPQDGRFTFRGAGQYYDPGATARRDAPARSTRKIEYVPDSRLPPLSTPEEVESWKAAELAKHGRKPGYRRAIEEQYRRYLHQLANPLRDSAKVADGQASSTSTRKPNPTAGAGFPGRGGGFGGGGATGSWETPPTSQRRQRQDDRSRGDGGFSSGGGSFGGGGASSSVWPATQANRTTAKQVGAHNSQPPGRWRQATRNGYLFEIDEQNRTRRVSGEITFKLDQRRSKKAQRAAGGADRRASDEGGHYIARRFNGPTEAFNHFAQDRNFNRGDYSRLEEEWARAKRVGKSVRVKIVPEYKSRSKRPSSLNVWFWIDGVRKSARSQTSRREKRMSDNSTEQLLNLIGELLAEDIDYPVDNTLLHAEVGRAYVSPSIFEDRGNHILYRDPDLNRLGDALLDLWEAQQGPDRWAEIEYIVRKGRFDATFIYPEEIDPAEEPLDRRRRIVAKYLGDKPIIYPPDEDDDSFEL